MKVKISKAAALAVDKKWLFFVLLVVAALAVSIFFKDLKIDNSLEGWFLENDPTLTAYNEFKDMYGNDEIISVLVDMGQKGLTKEIITDFYSLSNELEKNPLVKRVLSVTSAPYMDGADGELTVEDLLPRAPGDDFKPGELEKRINSSPLWKKLLYSKDRKSVMFLIEPSPVKSKDMDEKRPEILRLVKNTFTSYGLNFKTAGMGVMYEELNNISMKDATLFPTIAYCILILVLFIFFRKKSVLVASTMTMFFSVLLFLGFYAMCGQKIDLLGAILPTLIIIISLADVVHIFLHYEKTENGPDKLKRNLTYVITPCLFTSITTAIGFFSLASSPMAILKNFGIFASIGVMFAFVVTIIICTLVLSGVEKRDEKISGEIKDDLTDKFLSWLVIFVTEKYKYIILVGCIIIIAGIAGLLRLNIDTYSIDFLLDSNKVKQESKYIETDYGYYLPLEIRLKPDSPEGVKNPVFLKKLSKLQGLFDSMNEFDKSTALPDIVKQLNKVLTENDDASYKIPETRNAVAQELLLYELDEDNDLSYSVSKDYSELRLTLKIPMVSGKNMKRIMNKADDMFKDVFGDSVKITHGGYIPLYVKLLEYITTSQVESFSIAFIAIFAIMGLLFRSFSVLITGIIPNIVPVLITLGFMGFAGIKLDIATVTIAVIVIGIAVDDTIHFIFTYRKFLSEGKSVAESIEGTLKSSGKAIIITSVMLITGFIIMVFASIKSVIFFGLLISVSMFSAVVCDLMLLPAILLFTAPSNKGIS